MVTTRQGTILTPNTTQPRSLELTNGPVTPESPEVELITPQQTDQDATRAASLRVHFAIAIEGLLKVADREDAVLELRNIVTGLQPTDRLCLPKFFLQLAQEFRDSHLPAVKKG